MKTFGKTIMAVGLVSGMTVGTYAYLKNKNKVNKVIKKTYDDLIK